VRTLGLQVTLHSQAKHPTQARCLLDLADGSYAMFLHVTGALQWSRTLVEKRSQVMFRPTDCAFYMLSHTYSLLEAAAIPWGVVTNKPAWLTLPLLAALGLAEDPCCVVSGDTLAQRKPHPAPLLHACRVSAVAPTRAVYVGDAERDIVAGRAAGLRTLVATYGYLGPNDRWQDWQADGAIDHPCELLGHLPAELIDRVLP